MKAKSDKFSWNTQIFLDSSKFEESILPVYYIEKLKLLHKSYNF